MIFDPEDFETRLRTLSRLTPLPQGTPLGDAYRHELRGVCVIVREVFRKGYRIIRFGGMFNKSLYGYQLMPLDNEAFERVLQAEKMPEDENLRNYECIVLELIKEVLSDFV